MQKIANAKNLQIQKALITHGRARQGHDLVKVTFSNQIQIQLRTKIQNTKSFLHIESQIQQHIARLNHAEYRILTYNKKGDGNSVSRSVWFC